ncbi:MAG: hypothetical protein AB7K71_29840 [Polyangiaceae bacterium]
MLKRPITSRIIPVGLSVLLGASLSAGCGGSSTGGSGSGGSGAAAGNAGTGQGGTSGGTATGGTAGAGNAGSGGTGLVPEDLACGVPSDCVLVTNGCCDSCGPPSAADRLAVNKNRVDQVAKAVCPEPEPCPKCASFPNPALVATCEAGRCKLVDLSLEPLAKCAVDSDCRLRSNTCCECGAPTDPGHLTAVNAQGGIEDIVCDPGSGCDLCQPEYPPDAVAVCFDGHCSASYYVE